MSNRDERRVDYFVASVSFAAFSAFALWLLDDRFDRAEERIMALESKPCLLSGAHTSCAKEGAR